MPPTLTAWVSSAWLIAQVAAAGDAWNARMERAIALRLSGHEEEALAVFREAEKERTSPRFLAQMALTEQSLGLWVSAEGHLERALGSKNDPWIAKNRAALHGAQERIREHVGSLELRGDLRGELKVDGQTIGELPASSPVRLQVGPHQVEVLHPDAYPFQRKVEIRASETARETVVLSPVLKEGGPKTIVGTAPANAGERAVVSASPSPVPGIVLVSIGAAAAATGVGMLLASNGRANDYNDNAACLGRPTDPPACDADASATRTYRTISVVSFVGAGISGLLGGWLLWRASKSAAPVNASISDHGVSVTFGQRF